MIVARSSRDSPSARDVPCSSYAPAIAESADALDGVRHLLGLLLADPIRRATVDSTFAKAVAELRAHPEFATFNRLRFIAGSARAAGAALTDAQHELGAPEPSVRRFWRESAGTPFDVDAFSAEAFPNVAVTGPYMHNGVFETIEEVIEFYDRGGGVGIGLALPYQSLPAAPLRLTADEKRDLVTFLGALTDTIPKPMRGRRPDGSVRRASR